MLGEVIGEASGSVTSVDVVSEEQGSAKRKVSMRGSGKARGVALKHNGRFRRATVLTVLAVFSMVQRSGHRQGQLGFKRESSPLRVSFMDVRCRG